MTRGRRYTWPHSPRLVARGSATLAGRSLARPRLMAPWKEHQDRQGSATLAGRSLARPRLVAPWKEHQDGQGCGMAAIDWSQTEARMPLAVSAAALHPAVPHVRAGYGNAARRMCIQGGSIAGGWPMGWLIGQRLFGREGSVLFR